LVPILEEEDNRPEFDIHAYTKRVVNAIEEESGRLHETNKSEGVNKVRFGNVFEFHQNIQNLFLMQTLFVDLLDTQ